MKIFWKGLGRTCITRTPPCNINLLIVYDQKVEIIHSLPMTTPLYDFLMKLQPAGIIPFLQEKELIPRSIECLCRNEMTIQLYNRCLDGFIFRYARCKKTRSIKDGRFFKNTSISISKIMQLIFLWITETPVSSASTLIAVSNKTAIQ